MKVIFHENQLSYRGTSVALYDYADFNEKILGNESIILYDISNENSNDSAIKKFENRFKVLSYNDHSEINEIVAVENADVFYAIKSGERDDVVAKGVKNCIHVVFKVNQPHGDVYAYVSKWLRDEVNKAAPYVPHIIHLPETTVDMRQELGIGKTDKVFGCYGGYDSFDLKFVQRIVKKTARENSNIFFIFMGIADFTYKKLFWEKKWDGANILFLPANSDLEYKSKFVNTCDAMLHARKRGETFGMAIGEFAIKGKTIITYRKSKEKCHIDILQKNALYYSTKSELKEIFLNKELNLNASENYTQFSPENVMQLFNDVFLKK